MGNEASDHNEASDGSEASGQQQLTIKADNSVACHDHSCPALDNIVVMLVMSRVVKAGLVRAGFSHLSVLARYLQPVSLPLTQAPQMPTLQLKSEQYLLHNWWSEAPFQLTPSLPMHVPVFGFLDGKYTGQQIQLPSDIFNRPLRRDLMHRLYDFRIRLDKFTTKTTRNRATTFGSGHKMRKQKGMGAARMGDKRAPHLWKGGKAHGAKPKVYSYPLNAKIKINALKALLSAKLAEGKIKIIDSEAIAESKTKLVASAVSHHATDERVIVCIITERNGDRNFELAQKNFRRVLWHDSYSLDVLSLFKADRILITQRGLEQLVESIYKTTYMAYRHPSMAKLSQGQETKEEEKGVEVDPSQPYEFKFRILGEYMERYQKLRREQPELLEREQFKTTRYSDGV